MSTNTELFDKILNAIQVGFQEPTMEELREENKRLRAQAVRSELVRENEYLKRRMGGLR